MDQHFRTTRRSRPSDNDFKPTSIPKLNLKSLKPLPATKSFKSPRNDAAKSKSNNFLTPPPINREKKIAPGAPARKRKRTTGSSSSSSASDSSPEDLFHSPKIHRVQYPPKKLDLDSPPSSPKVTGRRRSNKDSMERSTSTVSPMKKTKASSMKTPSPKRKSSIVKRRKTSSNTATPSKSSLFTSVSSSISSTSATPSPISSSSSSSSSTSASSLITPIKKKQKRSSNSGGYRPSSTLRGSSSKRKGQGQGKIKSRASDFAARFAGRRIVPSRALSASGTVATQRETPASTTSYSSSSSSSSSSFDNKSSIKSKIIRKDVQLSIMSTAGSSTISEQHDTTKEESILRTRLYGMAVPKHIRSMYSTVRSAVGALGGAGAGGAIYGEVTMTSFHRLILYLQSTTQLNNQSIFLDVGAGLGKPNLHVAALTKCVSIGIELIGSRWWRSLSVMKQMLKKEMHCPPPLFVHADMMDIQTLNPFSHIYTFDRGVSHYCFELISVYKCLTFFFIVY